MAGKLIIFDGGEGTGKSTQIVLAKEYFGNRVITTREPGGCPNAEKIREFLFSEEGKKLPLVAQFNLMWAARATHLQDTIIPALENNKIVLCDRFASSTWAYQVCAEEGGRTLAELFWEQYEVVLDKVVPDLYVYFDIDPVKGLARKGKQPTGELNYFDGKPLAYHQKVHTGFHEFMANVDHAKVNADQSIEDVWRDLLRILRDFTG